MKKTVKAESVNCEVCGLEFLNYQIRSIKVGSILKNACSECHEKTSTYKEFKESLAVLQELQKLGQLNAKIDPMVDSPNISIEPIEPNIQAACELLKRMDSNYFKGVSKIVAGAEANYGHVANGPNEDPHVVHINLNRITSEAGPNAKREIICQLAQTIAHEVGHIRSFDEKNGFKNGESPAEAEERKVASWIKANEVRLQDLFK